MQQLRNIQVINIWDHLFSVYAKFLKNLKFLILRFAHMRLRVHVWQGSKYGPQV